MKTKFFSKTGNLQRDMLEYYACKVTDYMLDNIKKHKLDYVKAMRTYKLIEKYDFTTIQQVLKNDPTAFSWINVHNDTSVYINIKNHDGWSDSYMIGNI